MADDADIEQGGAGDDEGAPSLPSSLAGIVQDLPAGPGQDYIREASQKFSDFWAKQQAAERVTATGQKFADGVNNFTDQMVAGIHNNPAFSDTAIDMSHSVAKALVHDHPFLDDDQRPALAEQLGNEFTSKLARAGAMRWALTNPDEAHALLDRWQHRMAPGDVQQARDAVDVIHDQRQTDAAQQAVAADAQRAKLSSDTLVNIAEGIATRGVPPNFNTNAIVDGRLSDEDRRLARDLAARATDIQNNAGLENNDGGKPIITKPSALIQAVQTLGKGGEDASIPKILRGLVLDNQQTTLQDGALFGKLLQNPDDAKLFAGVLQGAIVRNSVDGENLTDANAARLSDMAHFLLKQYSQIGAAAFDNLPLNPLAKGGLEAQEQAQAQKAATARAKLEDIFARREAHTVYQQQKQQFELAKFQAEQTYRKEHAAEEAKTREQAREDRRRELAEARAERAQQAALNRQARAQEAAARLDEQRAAREQRALIEAQRPERATSGADEFARASRRFRELHRGP